MRFEPVRGHRLNDDRIFRSLRIDPQRGGQLTDATGVTPAVDQVESHPFLPQNELLDYCNTHQIALTAYSPLGSGDRPEQMKADDEPPLLEHPVVTQVANDHDTTAGAVLIAWHLQRGVSVIPKSTNASRIAQNLAAANDLTLSDDAMHALAGLDRGYRFVNGRFWCPPGSPYSLDTLFG